MLALWMSAVMMAGIAAEAGRQTGTACRLLAGAEIAAVQGTPIVDRTPSLGTARSLQVAQCFYTAAEFPRSVSLTVLTGDTRAYWQSTFHKPPAADVPAAAGAPVRTKKKSAPRFVPGAGDEAFWTGDARAGALYVLAGGTILRISVGGVTEEVERVRRSAALARHAVGRLR